MVNARPVIRIIHETPSTAVVDGDSGLGLVVAPLAMQVAIEKAEKVGTGWVSVQNSNHFGIAAYHAMMALEHDMIGVAMTNAGNQSYLCSRPRRHPTSICSRSRYHYGC
jgi:LDH2 family malate/lactate/ureidoglycolate dehydrogenase